MQGRSGPSRGHGGRGVPGGASILVRSGFYEGLEVPVDTDWLVIGRGRGADLLLADPTISRAHAAVGWDGRCFFLQDLGSTNGTLRNGRPCDRAPLADGDEVQIGTLQLSVRLAGGDTDA